MLFRTRVVRRRQRQRGFVWLLRRGIEPDRLELSFGGGRPIRVLGNDASLDPDFFYRGIYSEVETLLLAGALAEGDRFVDVGAGFGYFSVLAASLVGPEGAVVAFEPNPGQHELARYNLQGRGNARLVDAAVCASPGVQSLYCSASRMGRHSLHSANLPSVDYIVQARSTTLDIALGGLAPTMLKVDVEGGELEVLRGGLETIRKAHPILLLELWLPGLSRSGADGLKLLHILLDEGYAFWLLDEVELSATPHEVSDLLARIRSLRNQIGFVVATHRGDPTSPVAMLERGRERFRLELLYV
jgi:FkbM family methyltransferase